MGLSSKPMRSYGSTWKPWAQVWTHQS